MLVNIKLEKEKLLKTIAERGVQMENMKETAKKDSKKAAYMKKQANTAKDETIKL